MSPAAPGGPPPPRVAGLDIGTNTCSMVLLGREPAGAQYRVLEDYAVVSSLGRHRGPDGSLAERSVRRTIAVLKLFRRRLRVMQTGFVATAATSAVRDAPDGPAFIERVRAETGLRAEVLSGDEEAAAVFASVQREFDGPGGVASIDVGGGSTEVVIGGGGGIAARRSVDLGALRCTERELGGHAPPSPDALAALDDAMARALEGLARPARPPVAVGVGGTATTLLAVRDGVTPYDPARIHGVTVPLAELAALERQLAAKTVPEIAALPGMEAGRAPYAVAGARLLRAAAGWLGVEALTISDRGLRYGLLYRAFPSLRLR